jgi:glutamine amidotransferase
LGAEPINASNLLILPPHALAVQSYKPPFVPHLNESTLYDARKAKLRDSKVNMDGFGVGWFDYVVKTATPSRPLAKNARSQEPVTDEDTGLPTEQAQQLAAAVASRVVFAHIRAGSGAKVGVHNSHPFVVATAPHVADPHMRSSRSLLFMHNGVVHEFEALRPRLVDHIGMERRQHIAGETDSEYAGALLGHLLRQHPRHADSGDDSTLPLADLMDAVQQLVQHLDHLDADEDLTALDGFADVEGLAESLEAERDVKETGGCDAAHSLNFAVSDGFSLVATRFRSCLEQEPPSLYYGLGKLDASTGVISYGSSDDGKHLGPRSVVIASEPLSGPGAGAESWTLVHKDEMIGATLVDGGTRVEITRRCLSIACIADRRERAELARATGTDATGASHLDL